MKRIFFALFVVASACSDQPDETTRKDGFTPVLKNKEDSLYHDVMKGHDIGMAKMSALRKHITKVQQELDSLNKLSKARVDARYRQTLVDLNEDLTYADNAMFTWMDEFEVDSARDNKTQRLAYLESEKVKVEKVRDHILNALQRADSLFKK